MAQPYAHIPTLTPPCPAPPCARRQSAPVRRFAQAHKQALGIVSNTNLALLIWQTLSGSRETIVNTPFGSMLLVIVATFLIHVAYLILNSVVVAVLRLPLPEASTVVIMASQKVRGRGA